MDLNKNENRLDWLLRLYQLNQELHQLTLVEAPDSVNPTKMIAWFLIDIYPGLEYRVPFSQEDKEILLDPEPLVLIRRYVSIQRKKKINDDFIIKKVLSMLDEINRITNAPQIM